MTDKEITNALNTQEPVADNDSFYHIVYICSECAAESGGVWPKDDAATFHRARCGGCDQLKYLASVADWDWPNGLTVNLSRNAGRD